MTGRRVVCLLGVLGAAAAVGACGSRGVEVTRTDDTHAGAELFAQRCAGCHTLDVAGTQGSATSVKNRERVDGPNFNVRKEQVDQVLYAIRNGGFSGAIMPENIVVGKQAQQVAQFLAKYSGRQARSPKGPTQASSG
jgi:mono/diheme cytochrome c family protein